MVDSRPQAKHALELSFGLWEDSAGVAGILDSGLILTHLSRFAATPAHTYSVPFPCCVDGYRVLIWCL